MVRTDRLQLHDAVNILCVLIVCKYMDAVNILSLSSLNFEMEKQNECGMAHGLLIAIYICLFIVPMGLA